MICLTLTDHEPGLHGARDNHDGLALSRTRHATWIQLRFRHRRRRHSGTLLACFLRLRYVENPLKVTIVVCVTCALSVQHSRLNVCVLIVVCSAVVPAFGFQISFFRSCSAFVLAFYLTPPLTPLTQGTASEAALVTVSAARHRYLTSHHAPPEQISRMVLYQSTQAHISVQKSARIAGILRVNLIEVDEHLAMRPEALEAAIKVTRDLDFLSWCLLYHDQQSSLFFRLVFPCVSVWLSHSVAPSPL